jgi:hypothetical protein
LTLFCGELNFVSSENYAPFLQAGAARPTFLSRTLAELKQPVVEIEFFEMHACNSLISLAQI